MDDLPEHAPQTKRSLLILIKNLIVASSSLAAKLFPHSFRTSLLIRIKLNILFTLQFKGFSFIKPFDGCLLFQNFKHILHGVKFV